MNLVEQIYKGFGLIERGMALGKDTASIQYKVKNLQARLSEEVEQLKLSELERRDLAVEIYSEVLGCNLWLCSDEEMAGQVKDGAPGAVCYTARELSPLLKLKPGKESLRRINDIKVIFPGSNIKEANMKAGGEDEDHLLEGADIGRAELSDDES